MKDRSLILICLTIALIALIALMRRDTSVRQAAGPGSLSRDANPMLANPVPFELPRPSVKTMRRVK